jgi:hypothetical protein
MTDENPDSYYSDDAPGGEDEDDDASVRPGLAGVWICYNCERTLREQRDDFVIRNIASAGAKAYCDSCASKATDGLGRRSE